MSHTEGKLEQRGTCIFFAHNAGGFDLYRCPSAEDNARRLVACWNWCEGVSTEFMETRASPFSATILAPEKERDELLAALHEASKVIHAADLEFAPKTRALLAKHKAKP